MNAHFRAGLRIVALPLWLLPMVAARAQDHVHVPPVEPAPTAITLPPATPATDHSKMDHSKMGHAVAEPSTPSAFLPPPTPAERAAAFPEVVAHQMQDDAIGYFILADRLEAWDADRGSGLHWSGQAWIGTDTRRLWLRSEGESVGGHTEAADLEVFHGHSLSPWWELLMGVREDFAPGDAQTWAGIGVMGVAPQKFDVAATVYVGASGRTAARVDVDYDLLLGKGWVLQPRLEANLYGDTDAERGIGSGLATVEGGLWLRYEVTRQFAPYVGLVREHAFGDTAQFRRAQGDDTDEWRIVAGVRVWF